MKNIIKSAFILSLVVFLSILILFYVRKITFPYIVKQEKNEQIISYERVLPGYAAPEELTAILDNGEKFSYLVGEKNEDEIEKTAYVFISVIYGYNINIKMAAGVDEQSHILGLSIVQQTETPGLDARLVQNPGGENYSFLIPGRNFPGDKITESWFLEQFKRINLDRKIKILNIGSPESYSAETLLKKNAIIAVPGNVITTEVIVRKLADGFKKLKQARLKHEQSLVIEPDKEGIQ